MVYKHICMKRLTIFLLVIVLASCSRNNKIGYTVPVVDPTNNYDTRSVGVSANDLLSAKQYQVINLDICFVDKHPLPQSVIDDAVNFLGRYCNKPGGIYVHTRQIPMQGWKLYVNDLMTIEKIYRTKFEKAGKNGVDTLGLFVLVTEGDYYLENVLGVAYKNTSVALFDGIVTANSGGLAQPSRETLLSTVLRHEIGHMLGLVNIGTAMQTYHQDEANGKHCNNEQCLMYHKVQTTEVLSILTGNTIPDLDDNCKADLRANGGK